jgi:hypothetical protein
MIVHAKVQGGRYVIDEPAELPEGSVVELVVVEEPLDEMEADERAALFAQLDRGLDEVRRGVPGASADEVLRALGGRR